MDSKKLEILMTAVDLGSFSKASEVVGYTQSGLTHLVDSLEREIGLTLVRRDHSGIALTEEGEALMPAIREFLRANAKLENRIAAITEKSTRTIRVAAYASIAMRWMPEILYRFRRVCPHIDVDLRTVDHELEPFELLEKWQTDVIFAARQSGFACDWTPLHDDAMYAIVPADYPTNGQDFFPIEAFAGKEFLMPYGRFDIDVGAAFRKYGVEPIIRPCYVDDETVIRMVGKGLGISMMAEMMIRGQAHGRQDPAGPPLRQPRARHGPAPPRAAPPRHLPPPRMRAGVYRGAVKEKSGWRLQKETRRNTCGHSRRHIFRSQSCCRGTSTRQKLCAI